MPVWLGVSPLPPMLNCTILSDCCRLLAAVCWFWAWVPGWAPTGSPVNGKLTLGAGWPVWGAGSLMPALGAIAGPPGTGNLTPARGAGPTKPVGAPDVGHCIPRDSYARLISGALGFCVCWGGCACGFVTAIKYERV